MVDSSEELEDAEMLFKGQNQDTKTALGQSNADISVIDYQSNAPKTSEIKVENMQQVKPELVKMDLQHDNNQSSEIGTQWSPQE